MGKLGSKEKTKKSAGKPPYDSSVHYSTQHVGIGGEGRRSSLRVRIARASRLLRNYTIVTYSKTTQ